MSHIVSFGISTGFQLADLYKFQFAPHSYNIAIFAFFLGLNASKPSRDNIFYY